MKMKIKAILGAILILAACSGFAACSSNDDGDSGDSSTYDSKLAGGTYLDEQGTGYRFNSDHSVTNILGQNMTTTIREQKWRILEDGTKVEIYATVAGSGSTLTFDVDDSSFSALSYAIYGNARATYTRQ